MFQMLKSTKQQLKYVASNHQILGVGETDRQRERLQSQV